MLLCMMVPSKQLPKLFYPLQLGRTYSVTVSFRSLADVLQPFLPIRHGTEETQGILCSGLQDLCPRCLKDACDLRRHRMKGRRGAV